MLTQLIQSDQKHLGRMSDFVPGRHAHCPSRLLVLARVPLTRNDPDLGGLSLKDENDPPG